MSREMYQHLTEKVQESNLKPLEKPYDYQVLQWYDIMKCGDSEKLIYPMSDTSSLIQNYMHTYVNKIHETLGEWA